MPTKHINLATCGVISALKGSWEASPDQMLPDIKLWNTHPLPTCHLASLIETRGQHPYVGRSPYVGHPMCDALTDHPHIRMIWVASEIVKNISKKTKCYTSNNCAMIICIKSNRITTNRSQEFYWKQRLHHLWSCIIVTKSLRDIDMNYSH